jgi:hypothetical protein
LVAIASDCEPWQYFKIGFSPGYAITVQCYKMGQIRATFRKLTKSQLPEVQSSRSKMQHVAETSEHILSGLRRDRFTGAKVIALLVDNFSANLGRKSSPNAWRYSCLNAARSEESFLCLDKCPRSEPKLTVGTLASYVNLQTNRHNGKKDCSVAKQNGFG